MGGELPPVDEREGQVLLDDNLMELTNGRPFPLKHRAKVTTVALCAPTKYLANDFIVFWRSCSSTRPCRTTRSSYRS
jgi:hypothetical protein